MAILAQRRMPRQVAILSAAVWAVLAVPGVSHARSPEPFLRIPEADRAVLAAVACQYDLSGEAKRLLYAIYLAEGNEKDRARGLLDGHEMGVLMPEAQRYKGDHAKSLECQARWAAGTIRKRYQGDLAAFAARWAPRGADNDPTDLNRNWLPNVERFMTR